MGGSGGGGGGSGVFETDLLIYPSLVEMTAHKFYILWKWTPPECCGNYEYSSYKSRRRSPRTLSTAVFLRSVYSFYGCLFNFNSCSLLLFISFIECIKIIPHKMTLRNQSRFWKWPPRKMSPRLEVMNDQPPVVSGKDTKIKARVIVLSHEPLVGVDWKEGLFIV